MQGESRKCIAVFIARCERAYQQHILAGIYKAAFEHNMNVAVFGTTISGGVGFKTAGELSVYSIPNFDKLAGVIYLPDTFDFDGLHEAVTVPLLEAVRSKGIPAITIDYAVDGLNCFFSDDSNAVRTVSEHLITDHGCRDIAFMTGTKGHPHAERRLRFFAETMNSHGLSVPEDRVYYGDFWMNEADNFVSFLENGSRGMPEAIVCANEYMSKSVYIALRRHGYSIPKDVMLAGYSDNTDGMQYITAVSNCFDMTGYEACTALIGMMEGRQPSSVRTMVKCGCNLRSSITCGCGVSSDYDFTLTDNIEVDANGSYFSQFNMMEHDLLTKSNYIDMFGTLDYYTNFIPDIRGVYFCMREGWDEPDTGLADEISSEFTERMQLYYYRRVNENGEIDKMIGGRECFNLTDMFPMLTDGSGKPSSYVFRTLHFFDRCFGYVVLDNGSALQAHDEVFNYWLKDTANAIEAMRRLQNTKYLSQSDLMTGIYNRNGFNNISPSFIEAARSEGQQVLLAVCDLNGLKFINDTFGHTEGDSVIKAAAKLISGLSVRGSVSERSFRIGGDEFVKLAAGSFTEADIEEFRRAVRTACIEYNGRSGKKYPLYISVGVSTRSAEDSFTVDTLVSEADIRMYADKQSLKRETGFNPQRK